MAEKSDQTTSTFPSTGVTDPLLLLLQYKLVLLSDRGAELELRLQYRKSVSEYVSEAYNSAMSTKITGRSSES